MLMNTGEYITTDLSTEKDHVIHDCVINTTELDTSGV